MKKQNDTKSIENTYIYNNTRICSHKCIN